MLSSVSKACGVAKAPTAARGKAVIAKSQQRSGAALSAAAAALILVREPGQSRQTSKASHPQRHVLAAVCTQLEDANAEAMSALV